MKEFVAKWGSWLVFPLIVGIAVVVDMGTHSDVAVIAVIAGAALLLVWLVGKAKGAARR